MVAVDLVDIVRKYEEALLASSREAWGILLKLQQALGGRLNTETLTSLGFRSGSDIKSRRMPYDHVELRDLHFNRIVTVVTNVAGLKVIASWRLGDPVIEPIIEISGDHDAGVKFENQYSSLPADAQICGVERQLLVTNYLVARKN